MINYDTTVVLKIGKTSLHHNFNFSLSKKSVFFLAKCQNCLCATFSMTSTTEWRRSHTIINAGVGFVIYQQRCCWNIQRFIRADDNLRIIIRYPHHCIHPHMHYESNSSHRWPYLEHQEDRTSILTQISPSDFCQ